MLTKKELMQVCVNTYSGEYGTPVKVFDIARNFKRDNIEGQFGYIITANNILYINFQGSNGGRDWLDNFKFWKKNMREETKQVIPYSNVNSKIEVHSGMIHQYKKVRDIIHTEIKEKRPMKVIVFGHSLGGGLSTLCAVDIQFNFPGILLSVVTYGSPRVGNKYFVESYNRRVSDTMRIVNGKDLICKVPFNKLNYYHVGRLLKIGKRPWYKLFSVSDHYPQKYYKNL